MTVEIVYIREDLILGWRAACEAVAAERRYLGRLTLPAFDPENPFPRKHIENDWPMYVAVDGATVVGWADVSPVDVPECAHRGTLGMGVLAAYRGQGLGSRLLEACIEHAGRIRLRKIELTVYTSNTAAITLYRKHDFTEIGIIRDYRHLDRQNYDALLMERTLSWSAFPIKPEQSMRPEYDRLRARWLAGDRGRALQLQLMYFAWFHWADPSFATGLSDANEMEAAVIWRTLFDGFGAEQSDDAEFLYVAAIMVSIFPPPLAWHEIWDPRVERMRARLAELRPEGFTPADFEGRGDYGDYFANHSKPPLLPRG
jgi:ribosomal protein S18 acetylase RimI-like enzyme